MSNLRLTAVATILLLSASSQALAQYKWVDAKGVRHYSDKPPPAGEMVRVLAAPTSMQRLLEDHNDPIHAAIVAEGLTLAESEAEFRKRRIEAQQAQEKAALEAKQRRQQEQSCAIAQAAKERYQSGERIRTERSDNTREPMGDEERAIALARAEAVLADCPKPGAPT